MKYILGIVTCLLINFFCFADDSKHEHHHKENNTNKEKKKSIKAHQHGLSKLNIVQEDNSILFEFAMPGYDVVGFEYKAKKKVDVQKVKKAISIMSNSENMIKLSNKAECNNESSFADIIIEGSHTEFVSKYILKCNNVSKLAAIKIKFFDSFKFSEKLETTLITNKKKASFSNNLSNNVLNVDGFF